MWDVFISYRRSNGSQLASLLKVHLGALGLRVFLDVEGLVQGSFEEGLGVALENSRAVVCVLSEGSLDRCINDPENKVLAPERRTPEPNPNPNPHPSNRFER